MCTIYMQFTNILCFGISACEREKFRFLLSQDIRTKVKIHRSLSMHGLSSGFLESMFISESLHEKMIPTDLERKKGKTEHKKKKKKKTLYHPL